MYKTGKCKDCNYTGKLISGRCQSHYWKYRAKVKQQKNKEVNTQEKPTKDKAISDWFKMQKTQIPEHCEECGKSISVFKRGQFWTALIAHIVPKRLSKYPSVATHPLNRMFFCDSCHYKYDNKVGDEILQFRSLHMIRKRFSKVYESMTKQERNKAEIEYEFLFEPEEEEVAEKVNNARFYENLAILRSDPLTRFR